MNIFWKRIALLGAFIFGIGVFHATPASAQATRTWVSGVGDDANPCSRTAPCKTFAGAISKTAAGGEINCIDNGAFGAVTITKAITIDCVHNEAGVLATLGSNGIVVNAGANDVVILRGLDLNGAGTGNNGVRFLAGAALHIEDSVIRRFGTAGISFQPGGPSQLFLTRTTITANGANAAGGGGILVQPTGAAGSARATLRDVVLANNANNALRSDTTGNAGTGVIIVVDNSEMAGSAQGIALVQPGGAAPITMMLTNSLIANNSGFGIITNGAGVTVRVAASTITGNATGVNAAGSSSILSYGTNRLDGNPAFGAPNNGTFTGAILPQR